MSKIDVSGAAGLATPHTRMTRAEAAEVASAFYGIAGNMRRFDTEKDDTFHIATQDREEFVLKIANPNEPIEEIDFQTSLLEHVERFDSTLPIPRVVRTTDGATRTGYESHSGQLRQVRLLTFLPGLPLSETTSTNMQRERIGEILARLRHATAGFSHPADSRVLPWDVKHLCALADLLAYIPDQQHRYMLEKGLERFAAIEQQVAQCRQQVLHNDFSRSNIVVDPSHPQFVTGIIDFGDSVKTAIAIDVSTALLNQLPSSPRDDLFLEGRDIVRGYLRYADLLDEELRLIPHLVMARVVARALLTTWRAELIPENRTYIMRNTAQGWGQLEWFLDRSPEEISMQLL